MKRIGAQVTTLFSTWYQVTVHAHGLSIATRGPESEGSRPSIRPGVRQRLLLASDRRFGLDPQDLGERGAADLELALVGLARADQRAGSRSPGAAARGPAACRRGARDHANTSTATAVDASATAPPASGARALERAPQQQRARQVGGEHRRHQVRAAAVVLLGGVGARRRSSAS